jgi:dolichol-phosphate mannosyltransferase
LSGAPKTDSRPPPDPGRALVVIPTYNEREMLPAIAAAVLALPGGWKLLVVDDSSPDGTGELADDLASRDGRVTVLHRLRKEGLGPAYLAGFAEGLQRRDVDFLMEMDADFSHDPADLPRLLEAARDADLVIGSRWIPGGGTQGWDLRRRLLSRWGNAYVRLALGIPVRDATAGFRCWRRQALEAIDRSAVKTRGYGFQVEMAYRALKAGCQVVEVPICFTERRAGQSKMSGSIVSEALLLPWKLRRLR